MNFSNKIVQKKIARVAVMAVVIMTSGLITACSSKGDSNETGPIVGIEGAPRPYAGIYTGSCTITTPNRIYRGCETSVRVIERGRIFKVTTYFSTKVSNRNRNAGGVSGSNTDIFRVEGPAIVNSQNDQGMIGGNGFGFRRQNGTDFTFRLKAPGIYEYSGTFQDRTGRSVYVIGRVSR